jgi:outer membrane protein assembly factor BamB
MSKNKTAIAFASFLMFAMAISLVALPAANAHDPPWTIPTYAFIEVNPNPVGVNQTTYVNMWLDKVPPTAVMYWGMMWHNFEVTVTKPDGTTETLGPFSSDATGGAWTTYVPKSVGTYKFLFNFPGQTVVYENEYPYYNISLSGYYVDYDRINDTYTASTSKEVTLTVQQQPVTTAYPPNPLPTEYWSRPINSINREWYVLGGNWLGLSAGYPSPYAGGYNQNGNFNPYTTAPESAHVLWTKPLAFGGQIGGEFGSTETNIYATGTPYEAKFAAVILNGILYYNEYPGAWNNHGPLIAIDLRTGKTLWTMTTSDSTTLRFGMVYNFMTGNQYGGHAYLFTQTFSDIFLYPAFYITPETKWSMYDAMTGNWILDIANLTTTSNSYIGPGMLAEGPMGEILCYYSDGSTLTMWNASKCIEAGSEKYNFYATGSPAEDWRPPQGATIDWNGGNEWSVPIATDISGLPITPALAVATVTDDVVLMTGITWSSGIPGFQQPGYRVDAGYSAKDGHLLWGPINRTFTPFTSVMLFGYDNVVAAGEGVYTDYTCQTMTWNGYSLETGQKLWGPTKPYNSSWGYFDNEPKGVVGYGCLYTESMSGEVHCFDIKTGVEKWSWSAGSTVDTPYGVWPLGTFQGQYILADGKYYVMSGHDYTPPIFKGAKLYCLNATTGELIWSSLSFNMVNLPACADGIMVWSNGYDNQIYAYGKGPSATTVDAPMTSITLGKSVVVRGTVTDKSPGTEEYAQTARFSNGVPAIADDSMSAWMEYLYQQQPKPANATGVKVTVSVLDPNNNAYEVGTTTSTIDGFFKLSFTPPVPGEYYVYATFTGSESYWPSSAVTAINVEEAPTATPPPTPQPASIADLYLVPGIVGIIIAIAVVGAIIVLMLRKR